ncbi:MAG: peptidoglycan/LPS O-acetylase OafA/YrhL [Halieaceae bacterium]|jgi:peptidoglycan/LPS O-acetylase OafA/YrhL
MRYLNALDSLRAVAVLGVIVFHLEERWLPGGFTGVDVFFVISGYIVTRATLAHNTEMSPAAIAAFFARRARRILPPLAASLTLTALITVLLVPKSWLSDSIQMTGQWAFGGLSNFALVLSDDGYFAPRVDYNPFAHTGSLGVEEQFYLLFPLLLLALLAGRRNGTGYRPRYGVGLFIVLASILVAALHTRTAPDAASIGCRPASGSCVAV